VAVSWPTISLVSPISGFSQPVHVTHAGDGTGRLFVVEQAGRIRLVKNGTLQATPFLDIHTRVGCCGEQGLLSAAFPPGFAASGRFYVDYTNTAGNTVIARYRVTGNPDVADPASEQIILPIAQPFANHNGGQLAFGPNDGYLYIGMGDGGSSGDPGNRAQNPADLLGKILRIDVETGSPATYRVPASNPFVGAAGYRPEIWALGLRNPWRFSFDRANGDLYIADVGQSAREEVDYQPASSGGGQNYGWRIMEGFLCFNPSPCSSAGLTLPVVDYPHASGDCSITGGFVYRGPDYPGMQGIYFYGDYCTGRIWGLQFSGGSWQSLQLLDTSANIVSFGEDQDGNLYLSDLAAGTVSRIADSVAAPTVAAVSPSSGPSSGGSRVVVTGTGLQRGATVTLGTAAAAHVLVSSSTQLTANTGAHAAGPVTVVVTNPDTKFGSLPSGFTYVDVSGLSPLNLIPDARSSSVTLGAAGLALRATLAAARSYAVEAETPFTGEDTLSGGGPLLLLSATRGDGNALDNGVAGPFPCSASPTGIFLRATAADAAAGPVEIVAIDPLSSGYRIRTRLAETSLFCPRWSVNGYVAFIDVQNTSDCAVSGAVALAAGSGSTVATLLFTLAGGSAIQIAVPSMLSSNPGSAVLTHDSPPGSIAAGIYMTQPGAGQASFRWPFREVRSYGASDGR
jgi:glucose/arabinose dehydrogenase